MAQDRPKRLFFVSEFDPHGRPAAWFGDIPARDLDEVDIAALTDEQIERATESKLYQKTEPKNPPTPPKTPTPPELPEPSEPPAEGGEPKE